MATSFKIKGMKGLEIALSPSKFATASKEKIRRATALNGKLAAGEMRRLIRKGIKPENAALTQAIKGGDKPLVDSSKLFESITSKVTSDVEAFVGVLRTNENYNIAAIVHEGATLNVTPAMKGMFFFLWKASSGELDPSKLQGRARELWERSTNWRPLGPDTKAINIASRPFVEETFSSKRLIDLAKYNWERALGSTFKKIASEGKNTKK